MNKTKIKVILVIAVFIIAGIVIYKNPLFTNTTVFMNNNYKLPEVSSILPFTDTTFYGCILDNYNRQNRTNLSSLTDEQLGTIKFLTCIGPEDVLPICDETTGICMGKSAIQRYGGIKRLENKIVSVNGIEKLVNLKSLNLNYNDLTTINLDNNLNLTALYINDNKLANIDLSKNTKLEELEIKNNNLSSLDLSKNLSLNNIDVSNNKIYTLKINDSVNNSQFFNEINYQTLINFDKDRILKPIENYKYYYGKRIDIDENITYNEFITGLRLQNLSAIVYNLQGNIITEGNILDSYKLSIIDGDQILQSNLEIKVKKLTSPDSRFEDAYFYSCILKNYNTLRRTNFTILTDEQLKTITSLSCVGPKKEESNSYCVGDVCYGSSNAQSHNGIPKIEKEITSIVGIENLPFLENLYLNNNNLTTADVSKNLELTNLEIKNNNLTSLNISKNTKLKSLDVSNNNLESINLASNTELIKINLQSNSFQNIDLSKNTLLTRINLNNNKISNLNLQNNLDLIYLDINKNIINNLDVSKNTQLTRLNAVENLLTSLDLSKNIELDYINLNTNNIGSLNVDNNIKLKLLDVGNNSLANLDLLKCTNLENLYLNNNNFTSLDVSNNKNLKSLNLTFNNLKSIDLKNNIELSELNISNNAIETIGLDNNVNLESLEIDNNFLKSLDISKNLILKNLYIENNNLEKLIFKGNNVLENLFISNNYSLEKIDISDLKKIDYTDIFVNSKKFEIKKSMTVIDFLNTYSKNLNIKLQDRNGNIIFGDTKIGTGSKIINLDSDNNYASIAIIMGDITGDGNTSISDVSKLYQYLKKKIEMDECYVEAGNVVNIDKEIKISDVAKLYQFLKGRINEL